MRLFVDQNEEITSVISKIKRIKEKKITLVVPTGAVLFSSVINLKLLKDQAKKLGKEISILTQDKEGINLASICGFPVYHESISQPQKEKKTFSRKKKTIKIPKGVIIGGFSILFLLILLIYLFFPQVELTIDLPAIETEGEFEIELTSDLRKPVLSYPSYKIPIKIYEKIAEEKKEFKSSGEKDIGNKAKGTIIIYNKTGEAQPLIKDTQFLSKEGLIFKSTHFVLVPPATVSPLGDVIPAQVEVQVEALKPGEQYNIPPTRFTIPGLPGREEVIFGISKANMEGGSSKKVKIVTQEDLINAENDLKALLSQKLKEELEEEARKKQELFLEELLEEEILTHLASKQAEEEAENFEYFLKLKLKNIRFSKRDLEKVIADFISNSLAQDRERVFKEKEEKEFKIVETNFKEGKAKLISRLKYFTGKKIDKASLRKKLVSLTKEEAEELLDKEFTSYELKFFPSFLKRFPLAEPSIKIKVNYKL